MSIQGNINQALGIGAGLVSANKIADAKAAKVKVQEAKAEEKPVTPAEEAKAAGVHLKRIKKRLRRMQKANEKAQLRQGVKMAQKSIIETNINKWGTL